MKENYIHWMEQALSAYSDAHIQRYFESVKQNGLTEHGFPRLTANIGILLSHGRRTDLLPLFSEMMEFCCKTIPTVKAANDFSVREIVCCVLELERSKILPQTETDRWRGYLATIVPTACYTTYAVLPTDKVTNWSIFSALSEYFRQSIGLCDSTDFIEMQLQVQMQWFDADGLYRDNLHETPHQPLLYDVASRGLLSLLFDRGYRGKYYAEMDAYLKRAALLTLAMQSPNGEIPFGGRSNQFVHNEAWMMAVYEYEAKRYAKEGDTAMAARFKSAAVRAGEVTAFWLSQRPIRHIKNRFPTETKYGCENYAYFDKYMITTASNLYAAYLICDDAVRAEAQPDTAPCTAVTSDYFHKLFLKSGGYGLEFDLNADPHYDANGLGRVHKAKAPPAICLSVPCPGTPLYVLDVENALPFSLSCAQREGEDWHFGAGPGTQYTLLSHGTENGHAQASLLCRFENGKTVKEHYSVSESGVSVRLEGEGEVAFGLPALCFDGEKKVKIEAGAHTLCICYEGWRCRYTTDGAVLPCPDKIAANRNGHYRVFVAQAQKTLSVRIEIEKC